MQPPDPEKTQSHEDQPADVEPPVIALFGESQYEIKRRLGKGGFAEVYLAEDLRTRQLVALKLLLPELAQNLEIVRRFQSVAEYTKGRKHPNIIEVYDYELIGERPTIVMEYVPGKSLEKILQEHGSLSVEEALCIAIQLCDALIYAHDIGIIHRDVKPSNIHITPENVVKLGDFDIAKISTDALVTQVGLQLGTPYYMSPEQIRREPDVDARSDVFSLVTVLYQMITGEIPVGHLRHPSDVNLAVPRCLDDTILKGLNRVRDARHSSMRELRDALTDSRRGEKRSGVLGRRLLRAVARKTKRSLRRVGNLQDPVLRLRADYRHQPAIIVADFLDNIYVGYRGPGMQGYVDVYHEEGGEERIWQDAGVPIAMCVGWDFKRTRPTSLFLVVQKKAGSLVQLMKSEYPDFIFHTIWEDSGVSERVVSIAVNSSNTLFGLFQTPNSKAEIRRFDVAQWSLVCTLDLESVIDMVISGCWFFVLHDRGMDSFEVDPLIPGFQQRTCPLRYPVCACVDDKGFVYVSDRSSRLFAFDVKTGKNLWFKEFENCKRFGIGSKRIWILESRSDGWHVRYYSLRAIWMKAQAQLLPQWGCEEEKKSGREL